MPACPAPFEDLHRSTQSKPLNTAMATHGAAPTPLHRNYFTFDPPARTAEFQFGGDLWNWTFTRPPTWSQANMGYILQYRIVKTPSAMTSTAMTFMPVDPPLLGASVCVPRLHHMDRAAEAFGPWTSHD